VSGAIDHRALVRRILELQDFDGRIRWIDGGLWDPWNHVQAAMGLTVAGEIDSAARALDYLGETQSEDGSWRADMGCAAPLTPDGRRIVPTAPQIVDTNFAAYVAVGVWHLACATGSVQVIKRHARMIARALHFAVLHQRADGSIAWRAPSPGESIATVDALVASASSIYKSLECGVRAFEAIDQPTDHWRAARGRLGAALRSPAPRVWTPKSEFAMEWYYPVLTGVLPRPLARARLAASWRRFVVKGWGCRCVEGEPWVTAAETAELAIALAASGSPDLARRLLATLARLRSPEGDIWMGWQIRENAPWPEERPSWTPGAVLVADDVARAASGGARVFLESLPEPEPARPPRRRSAQARQNAE
jgi:hypothetical protein